MIAAEATPLGVVLAGGRSSRLGTDKAALPFHGQALLRQVAQCVKRVTGTVYISGRDPAPCGVRAPWMPDVVTGCGPAGGVLTALEVLGRSCLVVSCDLPFLDEATLTRLLLAWRARPRHVLMTTFRIVETGYVESLVSVYEPEGAGMLRESLARGEQRLSGIFSEDVRFHIAYSRSDQPVARAFFNINSPPDLLRARDMEGPA